MDARPARLALPLARAAVVLALIIAAAAAGCQFPRDPDGTLDRVEGGVMRVGVTASDPWVELDGRGRPTGGVEVELLRRLARELDARIAWTDGSEEELVNGLKEGDLDIVAGGITNKTRWKKDVPPTRPYVRHEGDKHVMLVAPGENAWMVRVERFLLDREQQTEGRLARTGS
jgi:polar amino acid transport system substrate-binding protein